MGRPRHVVRTPVVGTLALAAVLVAPALASAAPSSAEGRAATRASAPHVVSVREIAGRSPYVGRQCNVATPYYTQPGGKEGEPFVAVDPRRPAHRVATWMDATRATVDVAYTGDGGRTWHRSAPRLIDECTGNWSQPWEASGDPWVSIGPDGVVYLSTLTWAHFVTPPASAYVSVVHVQTSRDGGRTWSRPVFLAGHAAV